MVDYMVLFIYMLCFGIVCITGLLFAVLIILKPFTPYFWAKFKNKSCMFIIQNDGRIAMMMADFRDSVYNQKPKAPWCFLKEDATLYRLGGVKCVPIVDNWNITKDCVLRDNVVKLEEYGIETYDQMRSKVDIEEAQERNMRHARIEGVDESLLEPINTDEFLLRNKPFMKHAFEIIEFDKIYDYIGTTWPKDIESYIDREISVFLNTFVLNKNKATNWTLIILLIAVGGGVLMLGVLGAKVLGLW